jgi:hypothetical protein
VGIFNIYRILFVKIRWIESLVVCLLIFFFCAYMGSGLLGCGACVFVCVCRVGYDFGGGREKTVYFTYVGCVVCSPLSARMLLPNIRISGGPFFLNHARLLE